MHKKITFFMLSDMSRHIVRQATVSKTFILFLSILMASGIIFMGFIICDYAYLKKASQNTPDLKNKFSYQFNEIKNLQKQIETFKSRIELFKSNLADLSQFEKKIRMIADIKKIESQETLFGVGGSTPDHLDLNGIHREKDISHINKMNPQEKNFAPASKDQKKDLKFLLKDHKDKIGLLASTPSIRPVADGKVISKFGFLQSSLTGKPEFHKGIDISNQAGAPVIATGGGLITFVGTYAGLGRLIVIDHGHGMVSRYANVQKILKKQGTVVQRGEVIALLGSAEPGVDSYIYYEIRLNGIPVNPVKYIF